MIKQRIIGYISDINTEWLINILLISAIRSFVSEDARTDTVLSLSNSAEFRYSYLKNISRTSTFWAKAIIRGKLVAGSGKCKKLLLTRTVWSRVLRQLSQDMHASFKILDRLSVAEDESTTSPCCVCCIDEDRKHCTRILFLPCKPKELETFAFKYYMQYTMEYQWSGKGGKRM